MKPQMAGVGAIQRPMSNTEDMISIRTINKVGIKLQVSSYIGNS